MSRELADAILPFESIEAMTDRRPALEEEALAVARTSLESLRVDGATALRDRIAAFEEWAPSDESRRRVRFDRDDLRGAVDRLETEDRGTIERTAGRIREFAEAQRACLRALRMPVAGTNLVAGHDLVPLDTAGCYAPGGRFPLPSSVLMTAIPARIAGVRTVRVAGPRPTDATLAAAWFAEADELLAAGGAHAVGALALGIEGPACDIVVGPGNAYVTAAKAIVAGGGWSERGPVAIDGLAGPSELLVLADESADAAVVAADLLAQAEHDPDAGVWFAATDAALRVAVREALAAACAALPEPNRGIASRSIGRGAAIVVDSEDELVGIADRLAAEHLEIQTRDAGGLADRITHAGAVFLDGAAEVFGDYGVGPNHVLPTGGTARHRAGLSVFDFLRVRTRLERDPAAPRGRAAEADVIRLARLEGLEAHARAAEIQRGTHPMPTRESTVAATSVDRGR